MPHLWSRSPGHFRGYSTPKKIEEWNTSETRRNVLIYDLQWCLLYKTLSFWGTPTNYKIHQNTMISNPFAGWGSKPESGRSFDCSELTMKRASVVHRAASCGGNRVMCSYSAKLGLAKKSIAGSLIIGFPGKNWPFLSIFMYDGQPINQIDCWMVAPPRSRNTLDTLTQLAQKSVAFLIAVCYSILLYRSIMNGLVSPWHLLYCCSCRSL